MGRVAHRHLLISHEADGVPAADLILASHLRQMRGQLFDLLHSVGNPGGVQEELDSNGLAVDIGQAGDEVEHAIFEVGETAGFGRTAAQPSTTATQYPSSRVISAR